MKKPFISVIIPTWRENKVLTRCLSSLSAQDYPPDKFEIILVSRENLAIKNKKIKVIKIEKRTNHAQARNIGVAKAKGEIFAFCDDDCVLPKKWLSTAIPYFTKKKADLIGGPIVPLKDSPFAYRIGGYLSGSKFTVGPSASRWRRLYPEQKANPFNLILANTFIRKKCFEEVDGFDSSQVPGEENFLYYKLDQMGRKLLYVPEIACQHPAKPIFLPYARKVFFYATGRGILLARRPKASHPLFWIPALFILTLPALVLLSFFSQLAFGCLLAILLVYCLLNIAQPLYIFWVRERDPRVLLVVPPATVLIHLSYGLGFLKGFLRYKLGRKDAVRMPGIFKA